MTNTSPDAFRRAAGARGAHAALGATRRRSDCSQPYDGKARPRSRRRVARSSVLLRRHRRARAGGAPKAFAQGGAGTCCRRRDLRRRWCCGARIVRGSRRAPPGQEEPHRLFHRVRRRAPREPRAGACPRSVVQVPHQRRAEDTLADLGRRTSKSRSREARTLTRLPTTLPRATRSRRPSRSAARQRRAWPTPTQDSRRGTGCRHRLAPDRVRCLGVIWPLYLDPVRHVRVVPTIDGRVRRPTNSTSSMLARDRHVATTRPHQIGVQHADLARVAGCLLWRPTSPRFVPE